MSSSTPPAAKPATARLWDAPTRIVHWTMVASVAALWWTAENGILVWHRRAGYLLLGLLIFRLMWGLFGSSTARFSSFIRGPVTVFGYARGLFRKDETRFILGHNPMGGWSVAAMLVLLLSQVSLGLFATDTDGLESGPLASYVSYEFSELARDWHETVFGWLQILIVLHLVAVAFYLFVKRENLIASMLHGQRRVKAADEPSMVAAPAWRAGLAAAIAAVVVWWVSKGAPGLPF